MLFVASPSTFSHVLCNREASTITNPTQQIMFQAPKRSHYIYFHSHLCLLLCETHNSFIEQEEKQGSHCNFKISLTY